MGTNEEIAPGSYFIEYSHDGVKWYGFGADMVKPPMKFDTESANRQFDYLLSNYQNLMKYIRMVNWNTLVIIRNDEL